MTMAPEWRAWAEDPNTDMADILANLWYHHGVLSKQPDSLNAAMDAEQSVCGEVFISMTAKWLREAIAKKELSVAVDREWEEIRMAHERANQRIP